MLRRFRGSTAFPPAEAEATESGTEEAVQLLDILVDLGASSDAAATFSGSKSSSKTREERTSLGMELQMKSKHSVWFMGEAGRQIVKIRGHCIVVYLFVCLHAVQRTAKRRGCLLSYSQAESGRELTQPSPAF